MPSDGAGSRVLFRADGGGELGTGHVMRTLALAEELIVSGGRAHLASARLDEALARRITASGVELHRGDVSPGSDADAAWTREVALETGATWTVADGYAFDERFQDVLLEAGQPLVLVDDFGHCKRYCAPLVLNPNLTADPSLYSHRHEDTQLLMGPRFAPLRREFVCCRGRGETIRARGERILVTMGGVDPDGATLRIVRALGQLRDPAARVRVVVGASNPHAASLIEEVKDPRIELLAGVADMTEPMRWADLAISAAGTTALELCFMGVPALLVVLAENQEHGAAALADAGVCENLGWSHALEPRTLVERIEALGEAPQERRDMARRGLDLLDARGGARVLEAMGLPEAIRRRAGA